VSKPGDSGHGLVSRSCAEPHGRAKQRLRLGLVWGFAGVLVFSVTLPVTRFTVGSLDPIVTGLGREVVAGVLAGAVLAGVGARPPRGRQWRQVAIVTLGVVVAWPLLTAEALRHVDASHSIVMTGLLSAFTALFAVLRTRERPSAAFWLATTGGLASIVAFALVQSAGSPDIADLLLLGAALLCAWGFAEGGLLSRELGAWQVIGWALVLGLPIVSPVVIWRVAESGLDAAPSAWAGLAYLGTFSAFLGFLPWYRGLAMGGIAKVGQLQQLSPALGLLWSVVLLGEQLDALLLLAIAAVMFFAFLIQRTEVSGGAEERDLR
jgi:drug/metabolite transporter (DMT)-like permease